MNTHIHNGPPLAADAKNSELSGTVWSLAMSGFRVLSICCLRGLEIRSNFSWAVEERVGLQLRNYSIDSIKNSSFNGLQATENYIYVIFFYVVQKPYIEKKIFWEMSLGICVQWKSKEVTITLHYIILYICYNLIRNNLFIFAYATWLPKPLSKTQSVWIAEIMVLTSHRIVLGDKMPPDKWEPSNWIMIKRFSDCWMNGHLKLH